MLNVMVPLGWASSNHIPCGRITLRTNNPLVPRGVVRSSGMLVTFEPLQALAQLWRLDAFLRSKNIYIYLQISTKLKKRKKILKRELRAETSALGASKIRFNAVLSEASLQLTRPTQGFSTSLRVDRIYCDKANFSPIRGFGVSPWTRSIFYGFFLNNLFK